jgi:hypothetical protein
MNAYAFALKAMKTARAVSYENASGIFILYACVPMGIMYVFIGTADEPTTVQKYGHENGASRFHKKKVRLWIRE